MEIYKLEFELNKNEEYRNLFSPKFFKKMKNISLMVINNNLYPLKEVIPTDNERGDKLIIKVIFFQRIKDKSYIFKECPLLMSISRIDKYNRKFNSNKGIHKIKKVEKNIVDYLRNNLKDILTNRILDLHISPQNIVYSFLSDKSERYIMIYKIPEDKNNIRILGRNFVNINFYNSLIIINNQIYYLKEEIEIKNIK